MEARGVKVILQQKSRDGSVKFLFELSDHDTVETLYMHDRSNRLTYNSTVCVSSQVGCSMGCLFCATGNQGFKRNLSFAEIAGQAELCGSYCEEPIKAVVFAGMGEPLLNYDNVKEAIFKLHKEHGINNFELATVGIVPGIYKLIEDFENRGVSIRLNLSLHATTNETRNWLIPANKRYNISDILKAAVDYADAFGKKSRIRYMLIKGINDSQDDLKRLCTLLENKPLKLIISAYNDNSIDGLNPPCENEVLNFYENIKRSIETNLFYNFGKDINGGCGQLRQLQRIR